jgi:hypothetical protein
MRAILEARDEQDKEGAIGSAWSLASVARLCDSYVARVPAPPDRPLWVEASAGLPNRFLGPIHVPMTCINFILSYTRSFNILF